MPKKQPERWMQCHICGHIFKRKSVRNTHCPHCGAWPAKPCKKPAAPCTCFSCEFHRKETTP